jgi:hypothetical protein
VQFDYQFNGIFTNLASKTAYNRKQNTGINPTKYAKKLLKSKKKRSRTEILERFLSGDPYGNRTCA